MKARRNLADFIHLYINASNNIQLHFVVRAWCVLGTSRRGASWKGPFHFVKNLHGITGEDLNVWYSKKRGAYHVRFVATTLGHARTNYVLLPFVKSIRSLRPFDARCPLQLLYHRYKPHHAVSPKHQGQEQSNNGEPLHHRL